MFSSFEVAILICNLDFHSNSYWLTFMFQIMNVIVNFGKWAVDFSKCHFLVRKVATVYSPILKY